MKNDPEVQRVVNTFEFGLPRIPVSGRTGELLGRGTGSSVEFQEYREYLPGDDVRHLDWAAYARSDSLMVRLYREEISPRLEILLDMSRSMNTGPRQHKQLVAKQLTAVFAMLSGQLGGRPIIRLLGDDIPVQQIGLDGLEALESLSFSAMTPLSEIVSGSQLKLQRRAIRIVLSDFLFQHDPSRFVRFLARDSSALWIIQVLNAWEADPHTMGGRHLIDIETGLENDMLLDEATINAYKSRLAQVQSEMLLACRRARANFVTVIADEGLSSLCRKALVPAEILKVR